MKNEINTSFLSPYMTVKLRPHPLCWSWCSVSVAVVSLRCAEEERPIVGAVFSTDEKHGGALRTERVMKR